MRPIWFLLIVFLTFNSLPACGGIKEKKLEKEGLTLIYRPKTQAGTAIQKLRMNHPIKISEEELKNHLYSLQYEEMFLLGKKKYVISRNDVEDISQILTKAVNRLKPENILVFELETPRGKTLGEIFAAENRLHFRFNSIKGTQFNFAPVNSLAGNSGSKWRLIPVKGQTNRTVNRFLGNSIKANWIVARMTLPQKSRRIAKNQTTKRPSSEASQPAPALTPSPAPSVPSGSSDQELEKKLKFLKDLRDKDLIDDEEYERKRKELLDSFL